MIQFPIGAFEKSSDRLAQRNRQPILHVFPTFAIGGVEVRMTNVINHFGNKYQHAIVAMDGDHSCKGRVSGEIAVDFLTFKTHKRHLLKNISLFRTALHKLQPCLLLTYNWGSMDWALANTLFPICRHVHLESGFGIEEADRQLLRRVLFRRLALSRTCHVIVPSKELVQIATNTWKLDSDKVIHIPNGIDCEKFAASKTSVMHLGFTKSRAELVVGTVAPLRPEKNIEMLLRAFAAIVGRNNVRLLIVGDGSERYRLEALASGLDIADRTVFMGNVEAVEDVLPVIDIFALTSKTEQMPSSVLQAMAAAKPIAAVDVGDVREMLAAENRPFVVPKNNEHEFGIVLARLLADANARTRLGLQNQAHVRTHYPQERMFEAYGKILQELLEDSSRLTLS